ncbi:DUF3261 domain-containing protein [Pseudomonas aeruginosa]|uniref:DUF3261 domain-containing protein n=1 Tax=Pseudomonas aeruginosa TaxID=287 RepID=UPI003335770D
MAGSDLSKTRSRLEVQWKQQSFSFLLYQQQKGAVLDVVALSLTGQQLFKLQFDGHRVHVEQRIDQNAVYCLLRFVVRDLLFATYPAVFAFRATSCRDETTSRLKQVVYIEKAACVTA